MTLLGRYHRHACTHKSRPRRQPIVEWQRDRLTQAQQQARQQANACGHGHRTHRFVAHIAACHLNTFGRRLAPSMATLAARARRLFSPPATVSWESPELGWVKVSMVRSLSSKWSAGTRAGSDDHRHSPVEVNTDSAKTVRRGLFARQPKRLQASRSWRAETVCFSLCAGAPAFMPPAHELQWARKDHLLDTRIPRCSKLPAAPLRARTRFAGTDSFHLPFLATTSEVARDLAVQEGVPLDEVQPRTLNGSVPGRD